MSIFANETPENGAVRVPSVEVIGDSGFAAFGKPVPFYRRSAGNAHLKDMGVSDPEIRFSCIEAMSEAISRDDAHGAMNEAYKHVDVTGVYRLLAVLCAATETAS